MDKQLKNNDIFRALEQMAPKHFAYEWDNVGLQIGSSNHLVKKIMTTLDVTEAVVDEAIEKDVSLLIAHHPMFFNPLKQLNVDSIQGRIIKKLLSHNISVYAAHTNLDIADGGINDMLAQKLGIKVKGVMEDVFTEKLYKLAVFVPKTHVDSVMDALSESGAGHIGNYSHCVFQTEGEGSFKPLEGTSPFIGKENQLEKVNEIKLETIVPEENVSRAVAAMLEAHPYEEVAYDIYLLSNKGKNYGIGRIGELEEDMTLADFVAHVKQSLGVRGLRVVGNLSKNIRTVAILGGSGEKYIPQAIHKKADVFITGDVTFHTAQNALDRGLGIIDPGHYIEAIMKQSMKDFLKQLSSAYGVDVIASAVNTDPFQFL
ncbi:MULTISPECIES: Nif3-like dinuclear metal center hexameric protein [unclassified Virgibacillus]|uniref:Nif3-like dinuclear metal center hexameric protein n=1 Tax=unclassified Virgibacillus TaxID=2620237 RepID=UPI0024DE3418|nr:Nif3-like dinuclear metal center hexameric protein [Virgibacillus sp. LDC-1]